MDGPFGVSIEVAEMGLIHAGHLPPGGDKVRVAYRARLYRGDVEGQQRFEVSVVGTLGKFTPFTEPVDLNLTPSRDKALVVQADGDITPHFMSVGGYSLRLSFQGRVLLAVPFELLI